MGLIRISQLILNLYDPFQVKHSLSVSVEELIDVEGVTDIVSIVHTKFYLADFEQLTVTNICNYKSEEHVPVQELNIRWPLKKNRQYVLYLTEIYIPQQYQDMISCEQKYVNQLRLASGNSPLQIP